MGGRRLLRVLGEGAASEPCGLYVAMPMNCVQDVHSKAQETVRRA